MRATIEWHYKEQAAGRDGITDPDVLAGLKTHFHPANLETMKASAEAAVFTPPEEPKPRRKKRSTADPILTAPE